MLEGMSGSDSEFVDWTVLAHLLRPQGRKGELLAELLTDFPERFENARVFLAKPQFDGPRSAAREMGVERHWLPVGRNHGRIVLAFAGIDSIEKAEEIAGLHVLVPTEERVPLEEDAEYISDLIGCMVLDGAAAIGTVTGVEFATTPDGSRRLEAAAPLLTVTGPDGGEMLIPYVQAFLISVDAAAKRIEMKLPEGLLEINRSGDRQE
jgi:16S rRNA processing protein RimM